MQLRSAVFFLSVLTFFTECSRDRRPLFKLLPPDRSGIDFENTIYESDSINILTIQYIYHGAAVAIGDFNNDGLSDIFFSGNMVANRLYLNRGGLKFEDVTELAGIAAKEKWKTGVALADVNNDGLLDIYVCATIKKDSADRANMLFINKGIDKNGVPAFEDRAEQYGVTDGGYSQNAAFLDYDKDGDLDLYVLRNIESDKIPSNYRPRITDGSALNNDKLYRNNGNNTFTDVTMEAGILIEGYGLGIAVADIDGDSWPDIYIGNDYVANDVLYINNRDGTFSNQIKDRLKHQSLFSMGVDIADVNNDTYPDIMTLDMLPENNLRRKTVSGAGATYFTYLNNMEYGYEFQYMRNMLQINNGNGTFSEVGQMAGVHQTEWSWSPLFIDVDNDGYRDLLITNGFPKDVTDRDYVMFKRETGIFNNQRSLIDSIPVLKVPNYAYRNNGDLSFTDKTKEWGMSRPSFSTGAAFADLDNDGDLDYVVNNINDPAFLYENTLYDGENKSPNNFLRIKLIGDAKNRSGLGTRITIQYDTGKVQTHDQSIYRGYLSTVEDIVHFGIADSRSVDTLIIRWPDGNHQTFYDVKANQVLAVRHDDRSVTKTIADKAGGKEPFYLEISGKLRINYKHKEWDKIDFYRQRTLPHKISQTGPGIAVGDINGDLLEDFIIGGSSLYDETVFIQNKNGGFTQSVLEKPDDKKAEDEGLLLFDADNDHDTDLYIVSGSYESEAGDEHHQDRLYLNDGKGRFKHSGNALPNTTASGSCVRAADFDADGDLDLFVGGRVVPGAYPLAPESYLLRNDAGKFTNATEQLCAELQKAGMITDALWTDFNNDDKIDLIVVGEFMPVTLYLNMGNNFTRVQNSGVQHLSGWWNSIDGADFDKDGDTDYIVGNLGLNNYYNISDKHPLRVYAKDFDANESTDAILSCYFKSEEGEMVEYPAHFWDELYGQSPKFRDQFSSYRQYGKTTMRDLLKPYDQTGMLVLTANYSQSAYMENNGSGTFAIRPLPRLAQVAPVNGIVINDTDNDGNLDVILVGNDYGNEVFSGRYDAFTGLVLLGDGRGSFNARPSVKSGFSADGDSKALARLNGISGELLLATQNLDSLQVFHRRSQNEKNISFQPGPNDSWAELFHSNGKKEKAEFYYGSGYLSQSTRSIALPPTVTKMIIHDFSGKQRTVEYKRLASQ